MPSFRPDPSERFRSETPDLMPVLSRGKHRNPRKGACFMELASFLAGERWSDHPRCTHPLLAELARLTNDCTSDANRSRLAELIPSVIGLTSEDVRVDAHIALRCALAALPVVSTDRQNVMAVSVLTANRVLADLEGRSRDSLDEPSRQALVHAPHATQWACRLTGAAGVSVRGFRRHAAPNTVRIAVQGIAEACVPEPDDLLRDLLTATIAEVSELVERDAAHRAMEPEQWAAACQLTQRR